MDWVTLYFRNPSPVHSVVEKPVELADIFFSLEGGIIDEVVSFTDSDGELLMFDPRTLLLLEALTTFGREGESEMLEEIESENES